MPRRLDPLRLDELSAEQRSLYSSIVSGPRGGASQPSSIVRPDGSLAGPFNAMLLSPAVGDALQSLGAALRYRGTLPGRIREMAILATAARWSSMFELRAHEIAGRAAGLTEAEVEELRRGGTPPLADEGERAALSAVRALLDRESLDDVEYEHALRDLGPEQLFEITALVGYYSTLALQLRVFGDGES